MNNEEKILEILTQMRSEMNEMRSEMSGMHSEVNGMRSEVNGMQDTLTRVAVTQEGVVLPRLQLALEGHTELARKIDTLATKEQVEKVAGDVSVIKDVVKSHSGEISRLKKAQ